MWVFCCGMYRSGSTLQFQITSEVIERMGKGERLEWAPIEDFPKVYEEFHSDSNQILVFKTHEISSEIKQLIENGLGKCIYVYRDLRDVCLSHMVKNDLTFAELIASGFIDKCLETYADWNSYSSDEAILISRYEEMTQDLSRETKRIAEFLGIVIEDQIADEIGEKYSVDNQVERIRKLSNEHLGSFGELTYDRHHLLHRNHINQGEMNSWEKAFSQEQLLVMEEKLGNWLYDHGYVE